MFKARNRVDGWLYAVKQAKRAFSSPADMHNTLKEVYALAALGSHPHVVRYYSAWVEDRLYIQTGIHATQRTQQKATHHTASVDDDDDDGSADILILTQQNIAAAARWRTI